MDLFLRVNNVGFVLIFLLFSDLFESGVITFDMILNIAYAELLPHAKELEELIAHELQVDINQVRLNFSVLYFGKSPTFWDLQLGHCRDYEVKVLMFGSSGRN